MIHDIVTKDLGFKSCTARWVPHEEQRLERCKEMLKAMNVRTIRKNWLVTDENLFYSRQVWVADNGQGDVPPSISKKKFMVFMAITFNGLYHFRVLEPTTTVNSRVYIDFLESTMSKWLDRSAPTWESLILQHDNARPHVSAESMAFLHHVQECDDSEAGSIHIHPTPTFVIASCFQCWR